MAIKKKITWRKATDDELKNGSCEMIIHEESEIDVPEDDLNSIAFREFIKMTPNEIEYLKYMLGITSTNKSSIRLLKNDEGQIEIISEISESRLPSWKKMLYKFGILKIK